MFTKNGRGVRREPQILPPSFSSYSSNPNFTTILLQFFYTEAASVGPSYGSSESPLSFAFRHPLAVNWIYPFSSGSARR